jgi:hypothetical protein
MDILTNAPHTKIIESDITEKLLSDLTTEQLCDLWAEGVLTPLELKYMNVLSDELDKERRCDY